MSYVHDSYGLCEINAACSRRDWANGTCTFSNDISTYIVHMIQYWKTVSFLMHIPPLRFIRFLLPKILHYMCSYCMSVSFIESALADTQSADILLCSFKYIRSLFLTGVLPSSH